MTEGPDPAVARFAVLQMVRLSGAVLVLIGMMLVAGRLPMLAGVPRLMGYVVAGAGLIDFFVVPPLLAKKWRSPK